MVADEVRKLSESTNRAVNEIDTSLSILVQSMSNATMRIDHNNESVSDLIKEGEGVMENFSSIRESITKNVTISDESLRIISEMREKVVSIIEEIQYMSALSFENSSFINEVDTIALEIADTDKRLDDTLGFFKTTRAPEIRIYTRSETSETSTSDDNIFF